MHTTGKHETSPCGGLIQFPSMKPLWGDSHYAGQMITRIKVNLGWTMQPVRALAVPKRGVLVPEGEEVDWDKLFPLKDKGTAL